MATPTKEELTIEIHRAAADVAALSSDIPALHRIKSVCAPNPNRRPRLRTEAARTREAAIVLIQAMDEQLATAHTLHGALSAQLDLLQEEELP